MLRHQNSTGTVFFIDVGRNATETYRTSLKFHVLRFWKDCETKIAEKTFFGLPSAA
jgi:hypothetical protein